MMARGVVFMSAVISYSLAYDANHVMKDENFAIVLEGQIQNSVALKGIIKNPSIMPILVKW